MSRSFKTKEKKLGEYIESIRELETQLGQANKNWSEMVSGTNTSNGIKEAFKNILREYGSYKEGGKFDAVRKYELGSPIKNVQGNADWFTHMYKHQSMQNWLNRWDTSNYKDFNALQDSWYNNLQATKYDPNHPQQAKGEGNAPSQAVLNRQKDWNKTGTNAAIEDANALGILKGNGGTSDNKQGQYQDGYFGAQEFLRHGGTDDSWYGHEKELEELRKFFKSRNLDYSPDENGMYKLHLLNSKEDPNKAPQNTTLNHENDDVYKEKTSTQITNGQFNIDPRIFSIAHNAYANAVNDRMTARQIKALRDNVTLYDPKNNTLALQGDLDAEMQGQKAAGQILHMASQPMTSDGAIQNAAYMDSINKAQDYIIQGRTINNQALRKKADEIWKLRYDDDAFNYNVAMGNRQILGDLGDNIANIQNAHDAKEFINNDVLWQEMMSGIKQKANKREAMEEQFALSDIKNDVKYNLSDYAKQSGTPLSKDEEEAWQAIVSGDKTYSELGGDDKEATARLQKAYMSAARKAAEIEQNKIRGYYNIPQSNYSSVRQVVTEDWYRQKPKNKNGGTLELKDGSKIAIAKIRERSKNADRFNKVIKDKHDRIDKAIARLDKKMYKRRDPEKRGK